MLLKCKHIYENIVIKDRDLRKILLSDLFREDHKEKYIISDTLYHVMINELNDTRKKNNYQKKC